MLAIPTNTLGPVKAGRLLVPATLPPQRSRAAPDEKDQSRLIEQLVERQELLLSAIRVINSRLKVLFICTLVTAAGLATCIAILLSR
jgi:hypothetical protein